jgi:hypothetical protein
MEWFTKDDATKPNVKKANNAWLVTRKKLFTDGVPAAAPADGGAAKVKAPATPRKKKDLDAPKNPQAKKTPAKKGEGKGEEDEEAASAPSPSTNGVVDKTAATAAAQTPDVETKETGEADVNESDEVVAAQRDVADADGDTTMVDPGSGKTTENVPTTPVNGASIADDMSAGSMSPSPASAKSKQAATPKLKATPKAHKTPNAETPASAAKVLLPDTPATPAPKTTPRKRKTKAEKDAEAAAANGGDAVGGDEDGKPPAKKRKSIDGKSIVKGEEADDAEAEAAGSDKSAKPTTPAKTPRKRSAAQIAKKEEREREKAAKKAEKEREKAEKEQEKANKKAEKEREKAEKQAAKKSTKSPAKPAAAKATAADAEGTTDSSKPKTHRKPASTTPAAQAKKAAASKEEADKTAREAKDKVEAARLALAAQEEINKKANDVFNGARIDKPASVAATEEDDDAADTDDEGEVAGTNGDGEAAQGDGGFIAINGTGSGRAGSAVAASETVAANVETVEEGDEDDGETIAVAEEKKIEVAIKVRGAAREDEGEGDDTIIVEE